MYSLLQTYLSNSDCGSPFLPLVLPSSRVIKSEPLLSRSIKSYPHPYTVNFKNNTKKDEWTYFFEVLFFCLIMHFHLHNHTKVHTLQYIYEYIRILRTLSFIAAIALDDFAGLNVGGGSLYISSGSISLGLDKALTFSLFGPELPIFPRGSFN